MHKSAFLLIMLSEHFRMEECLQQTIVLGNKLNVGWHIVEQKCVLLADYAFEAYLDGRLSSGVHQWPSCEKHVES